MSKNNRGVSSYTHTQQQRDHYANQHNTNNGSYRASNNNHANQLNPNHSSYQTPKNSR